MISRLRLRLKVLRLLLSNLLLLDILEDIIKERLKFWAFLFLQLSKKRRNNELTGNIAINKILAY